MKLEVRKSSIIQYFLIYLLICFQGSMGFRTYYNVFLIMTIVAAALVFLRKRRSIPQHYLVFLTTLFLLLLFEILFTDGGLELSSIISIMARFLIVMAAYYYDTELFADRFVKMVVFLAVISLFGFILSSTVPTILKALLTTRTETVTNYWRSYDVEYYGTFLYAFTNATARNIGIFHEPGLYQIVLNVALYILLFKRNALCITNRKWNIYCVVIIVTLVTTMSTTGLLGMIGLLVIYVLFAKEDNTLGPKLKYFLVFGLGIFGIYLFFADADSFINRYVLSKIMQNGKIDFSSSTGNSRIMSMMSDLAIFRENIFGIGYLKYNAAFSENLIDKTIADTSSCVGFTQVLAILGILVFTLIVLYYAFLIRRNMNGSEAIAFLFIFVNTGLGQPYIWFPALVVLLLFRKNEVYYMYE